MGNLKLQNISIMKKTVIVVAMVAGVGVIGLCWSLTAMNIIGGGYAGLVTNEFSVVRKSEAVEKKLNRSLLLAYKINAVRDANAKIDVSTDIEMMFDDIRKNANEVRASLPQTAADMDKFSQLYEDAVKICNNARELAIASTGSGSEALYETRERCDPALARAIEAIAAVSETISKTVDDRTEALSLKTRETITATVLFFGGGLLASVLLAVLGAAKTISRPLKTMTALMGRLAANDLTVDVIGVERKDELGRMAQAMEVFKENAVERARMAVEEETNRAARDHRAQLIVSIADSFEEVVHKVVESVADSTQSFEIMARTMAQDATRTQNQAERVGASIEEASCNVDAVAAAVQEMSSSVDEIGRQVVISARIANQAEEQARATDATVKSLDETSQRIGKVVDLIHSIAKQTNLLALNATIEAARAGDAGRGFAVVASEVKTLANQTAGATDEIASQIAAVQSATSQAVSAIKGIGDHVSQIHNITTLIAAAAEQQSAATKEIARNIAETSGETKAVSEAIGVVDDAARETEKQARDMLAASNELKLQSDQLRSDIAAFIDDIRAAR